MTMSNIIRIGIVGAGWITQQHVKAIEHIEGLQAYAITSRTQSKADALAQEFSIPHVYASLEEMMAGGDIDALMILVSADQMFAVAQQALTYEVPVFFEKPVGLSVEENKVLCDQAQAQGVKTMVGFNRRYYSVFHKGMKIINEHGPLLGVAIQGHERMWKQRVNTIRQRSDQVLDHWIFANAVHTIDLLRFFGGEITETKSFANSFVDPKGDQMAASIRFANGALGTYQAHWYSPGGWSVTLYGQGVRVDFAPLEQGVWTDVNFQTHSIEADEFDRDQKPGFYGQMVDFKNVILGNSVSQEFQDLAGSLETMTLADQLISECVKQPLPDQGLMAWVKQGATNEVD